MIMLVVLVLVVSMITVVMTNVPTSIVRWSRLAGWLVARKNILPQ